MKRFLTLIVLGSLACASPVDAAARWTPEKAQAWQREAGWLVGANFAPSTAINQLEMWQEDTFDPETIDRELGWAESLGFNSIRVFLHDIPWKEDRRGYVRRIDRFLEIADRHRIGVMFVFFDSVWDPHPHGGPQQDPVPHLHNSGWAQSPGVDILRDPRRFEQLKGYVQGVIRRYGRDRRVQVWDLWNEPDNNNGNSYRAWEIADKGPVITPLLKKTFEWAQEVDPVQPLTSGVWINDWSDRSKLRAWERVQLDESDVITYHNYGGAADQEKRIAWLRPYRRPLLCTEYMARPMGSTFEVVLPLLKKEGIGAYNWGFVSGKSQTIYPWDSWNKRYTAEPPLWFHDIFRANGTPYLAAEVALIRRLTARPAARRLMLPSGVQAFGRSGVQAFGRSGIQAFGRPCIQAFRRQASRRSPAGRCAGGEFGRVGAGFSLTYLPRSNGPEWLRFTPSNTAGAPLTSWSRRCGSIASSAWLTLALYRERTKSWAAGCRG